MKIGGETCKYKELKKLKETIDGRIVCVMAPGKSISGLEKKIYDLKQHDICWCSLNLFEPMERFILSRINRHLQIVYHSYTLSISIDKRNHYEKHTRIPRLRNFLNRSEPNLLITTWNLMKSFEHAGVRNFYPNYEKKTLLADNILGELVGINSSIIFLSVLAAGEPKKIILFGLDGVSLSSEKAIESYYRKEIYEKDKRLQFDSPKGTKLTIPTSSASDYMEKNFKGIFGSYCKKLNIKNQPEIVNCSPESMFTVFRKINYNQLGRELK